MTTEGALGAWVDRLGAELGLGDLPFAGRGVCEVRFEAGAVLTFEAARGGEALLLHAPVAALPAGGDAGALLFYERLLLENHVTTSAEGRALAVDPVLAEAVLWQAVAAAEIPDYDRFLAVVEAFVRHAADLEGALRGSGGPRDPSPAEGDLLFLYSHFLRA